MKEVIEKKMTLEVCPTSNIQFHFQPSYEEHAIIKLYRAGRVTINSDNMTLSRVTTHTGIDKALTRMGFTEADIRKMTEYAIEAVFLSDEEKAEKSSFFLSI